MEVAGVTKLFERSNVRPILPVRYTQYLGDTDSKGSASVVEKKPHTKDFVIEKLECIAHFDKGMGDEISQTTPYIVHNFQKHLFSEYGMWLI